MLYEVQVFHGLWGKLNLFAADEAAANKLAEAAKAKGMDVFSVLPLAEANKVRHWAVGLEAAALAA